METTAHALRRLRSAAVDGGLRRLCAEHRVELLVVFGSAVTDADSARDLDVAVRFGAYRAERVLPLLERLMALTRSDTIDLLVLDTAGPVVREQALVFGEPLFEFRPGGFAEAQIHAVMERLDTDHLRRLELELLAEGRP